VNGADRDALMRERLDTVRALIDRAGARAALLTARRNFAWATVGGESQVLLSSEQGVAGLLVTPTEEVVLTAVNEAARIAEEELAGLSIAVRAEPWHEPTGIDAAAARIAGGPPLDDAALEPHLRELRSVLAAPEANRMAWLAERAATTALEVVGRVTEGMTEHEVGSLATGALAAEGIRTPVVLVAADDRIERYRHPLPTGRAVRQRAMLVLVVERWGLHAAVTRFAELVPPSPDMERRLDATRAVHAAMVSATRAGDTLGDVLDAARTAYAAAGHPGEWELHHQGGIIGYQGRERIAIPNDPTVIRAGMAFAWNPSVAGAKAEETLLVDADGSRILTTSAA
jgi:Xaa-Pro dipeptidase